MKIVGVETTLFRQARDAARVPMQRDVVHTLVELSTDDGLTGIAIAPCACAATVEALTHNVLAGSDPRAAMRLWERMPAVTGGAGAAARAALDVAMWDLKAKANDEPLWKTLGGSGEPAVVHLSWDGACDADAMISWFRTMSAETGIRSGSMPAGDDPVADLERMAGVREALRATVPQSALMLHFDGSGWPGDAIRHVRILESAFDLTWVRSPVRHGDARGARQVSDAVAASVCVGAGLSRPADFLPYLQIHAANVIELDIAALGISGIVQMADAAFGFELPVVLSDCTGHLGAQLYSALPTPASCAIARRTSAEEICTSAVTFGDGRARPGDRPGNGLAIDRDALGARTVAKGVCE